MSLISVQNLHQYDINGNWIKTKSFDGFLITMDVDSHGEIFGIDLYSEFLAIISFEDAVASFTESFEKIKCDADSMINDPISVPPEISDALPITELMSNANSLAETGQHEEALLFYYIASQISPDKHIFTGIGNEQIHLCENDSALVAYHHVFRYI